MTLAGLLRLVALENGISVEEMRSVSRFKDVTSARHEFFYRALSETDRPSTVIGRACNKTHGAVLYGAAEHAIKNDLDIPRNAKSSKYIRAIKPSEGRYVSVDYR